MARRNAAEKHIRKLARTGTKGASFAITLPKDIIKRLGWHDRQSLVVLLEGDSIVIRKSSE